MKIMHICPSGFSDGLTYQENLLATQNKLDGHDVCIIASTDAINSQSKLVRGKPGAFQTIDGIPLLRLPYCPFLPHSLNRKLRMLQGLHSHLKSYQPDVILLHGAQCWALLTIRSYCKANPSVRCYADFHSDRHNSGTTWISRHILHGTLYRWIVHRAIDTVSAYLCISVEVMEFVEKYYKIPRAKLEFYPLGGVVYSDAEFHALRQRGRERLGLSETSVCVFQSGKFDRKKKLAETIRALRATDAQQIQLVIAGAFADDVRNEIETLITETPAVRFLGWVDSSSLAELLCASDVYVQPGTQSATMQLAICARCPVILDDAPSHKPFVTGNGWLVSTEADLVSVFRQIQSDPTILMKMSTQSLHLACALLDYRSLAARLYR
jgi:hypothetical protein